MSPRVLPTDASRVPVIPPGLSARARANMFLAFAVVPAVIAFADDRLGLRLLMGSLVVLLLTLSIGLRIMLGDVDERAVRVVAGTTSLRFAPTAAATLPTLALGLAGILVAVVQLVVDLAGLPTMTGSFLLFRLPYVLGVVGIGVLAYELWQLRLPAGLELTPDGLKGARGGGRVDWRWEELALVSVSKAPAAKLSLLPNGGRRPVLIRAGALGSDPNEVAAIVNYYRERPAERRFLAEGGPAAVRRVEDAVRARTA